MNGFHAHSKYLRHVALALLTVFALLPSSSTFAMGGTGTGKIGGSGSGAKPPSGGRLLGWSIGTATISQGFQCHDCDCHFQGPISITTTGAVQSCEIISTQTVPITCLGSASAACRTGLSGQTTLISFECCVLSGENRVCVTATVTLKSCP